MNRSIIVSILILICGITVSVIFSEEISGITQAVIIGLMIGGIVGALRGRFSKQ